MKYVRLASDRLQHSDPKSLSISLPPAPSISRSDLTSTTNNTSGISIAILKGATLGTAIGGPIGGVNDYLKIVSLTDNDTRLTLQEKRGNQVWRRFQESVGADSPSTSE